MTQADAQVNVTWFKYPFAAGQGRLRWFAAGVRRSFSPRNRIGHQAQLTGLFLPELRQAGEPMTVQVMIQARRDAPVWPSLFSKLHQ
jgi:hypothetical protein